MLFLKKLRLKNFCAYEDHTFDFCNNSNPYHFTCFYGPNGIGKSTILEAIALLSMNTEGRTPEHIKQSLRKFIRNQDSTNVHINDIGDMLIEGIFNYDRSEYTIQITKNGCVRDDLRDSKLLIDYLKWRNRISHFAKLDSDLSMYKFQLVVEKMNDFESIISEITRYPAKCIPPVSDTTYSYNYCTDLTFDKKGFNIHFKRMSAGEKKIVKTFSEILNLQHALANPVPGDMPMPGWPRLLLLDNIEMHVYYDRHIRFVDRIKSVFGEQQIFATTHSGTLINRHLAGESPSDELWIDVEKINS